MSMDLTEKISYIKGFAEGLNLDQSKDEVKVINKIIDLLGDMAESVAELQDCYDESVDIIDAINEDLLELEDYVYDDCDDCDCCDDDEENPLYEVTCPQCDEKIVVKEDELLCGEIDCPNCDAVLEFDFSDLMDDEHSDGCTCGCHDNEHLGEDDLMS